MPKRNSYSRKFKQTLVEDLRKNHLSYGEAMRKYGVGGKNVIRQWERIYLEEGAGRIKH